MTCARACIRWVTPRRSSDLPTPVGPHNSRKAKPPGSHTAWVSASSFRESIACSAAYFLKTSKRSGSAGGKGSDAGIDFLGISDILHRQAPLPGSPETALPWDALRGSCGVQGKQHSVPLQGYQ